LVDGQGHIHGFLCGDFFQGIQHIHTFAGSDISYLSFFLLNNNIKTQRAKNNFNYLVHDNLASLQSSQRLQFEQIGLPCQPQRIIGCIGLWHILQSSKGCFGFI